MCIHLLLREILHCITIPILCYMYYHIHHNYQGFRHHIHTIRCYILIHKFHNKYHMRQAHLPHIRSPILLSSIQESYNNLHWLNYDLHITHIQLCRCLQVFQNRCFKSNEFHSNKSIHFLFNKDRYIHLDSICFHHHMVKQRLDHLHKFHNKYLYLSVILLSNTIPIQLSSCYCIRLHSKYYHHHTNTFQNSYHLHRAPYRYQLTLGHKLQNKLLHLYNSILLQ